MIKKFKTKLFKAAALSTCAALLLASCAGSSKRPEPKELAANPAIIQTKMVWSVKTNPTDTPLEINTGKNKNGEYISLASTNGNIYIINSENGQIIHTINAGANLTAGVALEVNDTNIQASVITADNKIIFYADGVEKWQAQLPIQSYTVPLIAGGRVFLIGSNQSVFAFDADNGEPLWELAKRRSEALALKGSGAFTIVDNTLVAGLSGELVGINPDTGAVRWRVSTVATPATNDIERLNNIVGKIQKEGNLLCARAFEKSVACVNEEQNTLAWTRVAQGNTAIAADKDYVYASESDGKIITWQTKTGERAWVSTELEWRYLTAPLLLGRSVIFGDQKVGDIYMLSRENGKLLNLMKTDSSGIAAAPVFSGNKLIAVTKNGGVYAFSPE